MDCIAAGFKCLAAGGLGSEMAAQLERQLKAAQKFLRGVQSLPTFGDIQRKQVNELQRFFQKVDYLSTDASARLLEALEPQLWNHHTDELRQKIVDRTGKDDPTVRKLNQDYLAAVFYLTAPLVAKLERDRNRIQVLELLCQHLVRLGLRHPTEKTCGLILAMCFDWHGVAFEADKWQYTQLHKGTIQRLVDQPEPPVYLEVLPVEVAQCPPELFSLAFSDANQPVAIESAADLILRGRKWPMRVTNRIAGQGPVGKAAPSAAPDFFGIGQMVAGMMSTGQQPAASVTSSVVPQKTVKTSSPQLALEDGCVDDESVIAAPTKATVPEAAVTLAAGESGEKRVAQTLEVLKAQVGIEKSDPVKEEKKKVKEVTMKRPASKKVLKRPAAKAADASKGKVLKRPSSASLSQASQSASSRRERLLLSKIPPDLVEDWKDGCSRCYYRSYCTPSCWKRRGYTVV